jgi:hypothetical protein
LTCEPAWGARVDKGDLLDRFRRGGRPQCLTNVNLLYERFDAPGTSAVFLCRLIKSWRVIQQMVGRGLRPSANTMSELSRLDGPDCAADRVAAIRASDKPDALIADLVGLDERILQASAVEVLYSDEPEDVRAEMGRVLRARQADPPPRQGEEPDETALEEARANLLRRQQERLADMARRRAMAGGVGAAVSVTYGDGPRHGISSEGPGVLRSGATLGEKAMFVAHATQYDLQRATDIADRTARHQLKGMTFSMKRKLKSAGQRTEGRRAGAGPPPRGDEEARRGAGRRPPGGAARPDPRRRDQGDGRTRAAPGPRTAAW